MLSSFAFESFCLLLADTGAQKGHTSTISSSLASFSTLPSLGRPPKLNVLLETSHFAVVEKPALVQCHAWESRDPTRGWRYTIDKEDPHLAPSVLQRAQETFPKYASSIHFVHRLDRPTSGCLLLAFSPEVTKELHAAMKSAERSTKTYYAICRGNGEVLRNQGTIIADGPVKDSTGTPREAVTVIQGLWGSDQTDVLPRCCLVRAHPKTGRWHQIRQHLARLNHMCVLEKQHHPDRSENKRWKALDLFSPRATTRIDGHDGVGTDNDQEAFPTRVLLHCHRIELFPSTEHDRFIPLDGIDVRCPLPADMVAVIDRATWSKEARVALPELFG